MLLDEEKKLKIYPEPVILSYIQRYIGDDYEYKSNEKGHWINVASPFYNDRRKRLGFNIDSGIIFDFKLQKGWDLENFIVKHSKEVLHNGIFSIQKAAELLFKIRMELKKGGVEITAPKRSEFKEEGAERLPSLTNNDIPIGLCDFTKDRIMRDPIGRKAVMYLQKRNFKPEIIKKFGLQYIDQELCPLCNGKRFDGNGDKCPACKGWGKYKYHARIFIPTYEEEKLVYFQARDFIDRDKKYKYLNPKVERRQVVFFYDLLPEQDRIFGPEGPVDAMFLEQPSTAIMGNKISRGFAQKILWKKPKQFIFVPDFDEDVDTRKRIFSNLVYNINKIKDEATYPIEIGVYNWFSLTNAKDLNEGGINYVDDTKIIFPDKEKFKFKGMIHEVLKRP